MEKKRRVSRKMGSRRSMGAVSIIALILISLVGAAVYAFYELEEGNFHQITKGEAYRSAQMDGEKLTTCIVNYHIKSIINLRGKLNESWYAKEMKVCSNYGVRHYDVFLSAYHEPPAEATRILMDIFRTAPRPILIHCQGGADRSGLVAAMWKVCVDKEPKGEAGKQLSILYGHIPLGPPSAMDKFFKKWSPEESVHGEEVR